METAKSRFEFGNRIPILKPVEFKGNAKEPPYIFFCIIGELPFE